MTYHLTCAAQARAHAGPKPGPKPGPSRAQAGPRPDFWKFGNLGPGNLEIWDPTKIKKIKILKIKIRSAQNVGKVWISRNKNPPGPILGHLGPFFAWAGKIEKMPKFCLFSLVGPWALFTRFGAVEKAAAQKAAAEKAAHSADFCGMSDLQLVT